MKNKIKLLLPSLFVIFFLCLSTKRSDASKIIITREECNGTMNSIYCNILLEKQVDNEFISFNDYTISKFEILDEVFEYSRPDIALAGGESIVLILNPGKYRIKCLTPVDKQNNYLNTNAVWTSEYLYFDLTPNSTTSVAIKSQVDDNGYSGAWNLKKDK